MSIQDFEEIEETKDYLSLVWPKVFDFNGLVEIIEDRHARNSLIITSQLPVASWYDIIGDDTIADAILDRLVHTAYRIELSGDSLRKKR